MYFCDYETASSPAAPLSAQAQKSDVYVSPLIENAYRGAIGHPHRYCRHRERAEEKSWMWPTTVAYSQIAPFYDCTVGMEFFLRVRQAFSKLVRRYGIRFCSACDIGCGTGLFACYLNQCWGVPVYGVDRSLEMLRQANRNCPSAGVCFLQQDIRCLTLPSQVDLITANFDTLNHLNSPLDLRRAFERVAVNLRPGGHFYFDVLTPCQLASRYDVLVQNRCVKKSWLQQRIDWDPRTRLLRTVALEKRGGCCLPAITRVTERAYEPREIGTWLSDAGFIVRGVHDAETLQVATGCPPRIIVVAQKNARSGRIKLEG